MSRTLNLLEKLLTRARALLEIGHDLHALALLKKLLRWPNMPATNGHQLHHMLGDTYFQMRKYKLARRHFRRAVELQPKTANGYLQLARAIDHDPVIDARQASRYYRQALELAPDDPLVLQECGQYAVQMGRTRKGMKLLRRARELAPDNLDIIAALVEAQEDLHDFDAARQTLRLARFRFAGNSRFQQLSHDLEFRQLCRQQRDQVAAPAVVKRPETVPFLRLHSPEGKKIRVVRQDVSSRGGPHFPRVLQPSDTSQRS
jgi:tetratricopeptide (TPR) repeat protein